MSTQLASAVAEIERHVSAGGWDQPPRLYALVPTADLLRREPTLATRLGLGDATSAPLTPVEQEALPAQPLDEVLAGIAWPAEVVGAALVTEATVLPPDAEAEMPADGAAEWAAAHTGRREVRMAVGVLRGGSRAVTLRVRGASGSDDELLTGPELVPNLADALAATLLE